MGVCPMRCHGQGSHRFLSRQLVTGPGVRACGPCGLGRGPPVLSSSGLTSLLNPCLFALETFSCLVTGVLQSHPFVQLGIYPMGLQGGLVGGTAAGSDPRAVSAHRVAPGSDCATPTDRAPLTGFYFLGEEKGE